MQEQKKDVVKENKMGVMPVSKLLLSMAWPMMLSMLFQAFYNVVDSMFVSRITTGEMIYDEAGQFVSAGTDAISALGLAFPMQIIIIGICNGIGVGMNSVLSRALGEKKQKTVNDAAAHGVVLMFLGYLLVLLMGIFLAKPFIMAQGATGRKLEYGITYLRIVSCFSLAVNMEIIMERMLQSTGRTFYSMIPQITGAVINCIMDPILIYGLLGAPKMGVAGAAAATVFGQVVATIIGLYLNRTRNKEIHLTLRGFRFDPAILKAIFTVGVPAMIMQSVGAVMNFAMNRIILALNSSAVAVFTVYYKLQSFFFMPLFGMSNALIPIVAYNYGAGKRKRVIGAFKVSLCYAFGLAILGFLAFEILPGTLLKIFNTGDSTLLTLGVPALRKIGVHYLLAWFCIMAGTMFQSLGNGIYSMIVSMARQLLVLLPVAYIFGRIGGIDMVWWCFPVAEGMSVICSVFFYTRIYKNIIKNIPDPSDHKEVAVS